MINKEFNPIMRHPCWYRTGFDQTWKAGLYWAQEESGTFIVKDRKGATKRAKEVTFDKPNEPFEESNPYYDSNKEEEIEEEEIEEETDKEEFIPIPEKPSITIEWEYITTELAKEYMDVNFKRNRRIKPRLENRLMQALKDGYFYPIHQAMAFEKEGWLIDGQHRLSAIIKTGISAWLLVARGIDIKHIQAIDRGTIKLDYDNMNMLGDDVTHAEVAISKYMFYGIDAKGYYRYDLTGEPLRKFIHKHKYVISLVAKYRIKGVYGAILGMIAKAYYHIGEEETTHFLEVLKNGLATSPRDQPIIKLRDVAIAAKKSTGVIIANSLAKKTVTTLVAYKENRQLQKLLESSVDPFPIEGSLEYKEKKKKKTKRRSQPEPSLDWK